MDDNNLILIVEDSRSQALLLENILHRAQYKVAIAANGKIALEWLANNKPIMVISDIIMPELNGFELCTLIKSKKETMGIPVILLTSLSGTDEVIQGLNAGADSFITKPYEESYLNSHIQKVLSDQVLPFKERKSFGSEIIINGKKRFIQTDEQHVIQLLVNIYEGSIQRNLRLIEAQKKLQKVNENLEELVSERTKKLSQEIEIRKQADEKLQIEKANLEAIFQSSPTSMIIINENTNIVMANRAVRDLVGDDTDIKNMRPGLAFHCIHAFEDPKGCGYSKICKFCELRNVVENLIINGGFVRGSELSLQLIRNGLIQTRWLKLGIEPLNLNEKTHWCIALEDITERKATELELIKSRNLLSETEHIGKVGGWEFNIDTLEQIWTEETYHIHELDYNHLPTVEKGINYYTEKSKPIIANAVKLAIENGEPFNLELEIITAKGNLRAVHAIGRADIENRRVFGFFQDITKRKTAEEKILMNETNQKVLLEILKHDADNIHQFLDYALEKTIALTKSKIGHIYHYSEENKEFTLNSWSKDVMNDCATAEKQRVYQLDKTGIWGEAVRQRKPILVNDFHAPNSYKRGYPEGHTTLHKYLSIPIFMNDKIVGVVAVANKDTDYDDADVLQLTLLMDAVWKVVDRKQTQEQLKQKNEEIEAQNEEYKKINEELVIAIEKAEESDRLKSAFLSNMSHEIRTPMNGILGFTSLLKEQNLSGDERNEFIEIIERSGDRMLNTINDIIDISKIEAGQVQVSKSDVNINELLESLYKFFKPEANRKGINLQFKNAVTGEMAVTKTDKEKLYSVLTNLIKNSIKYSKSGTIEFGYFLKQEGKASHYEFFVKDNGIGIPKNRHEAIFDRFVQADIADRYAYEGNGLGLSICKAYVEMLGGKIWVESEEGNGSQFYFNIPYTNQKTNHPEILNNGHTDIENKWSMKLKILIAEDEEFTQRHLTVILKSIGKEILKAKDGLEAINLCREHKDIDLILMDIKMPRKNGYEALEEIRKFNKDVIIIAQTAYALPGDREKALNAGCNDYISKPINKEELTEKINQFFQN